MNAIFAFLLALGLLLPNRPLRAEEAPDIPEVKEILEDAPGNTGDAKEVDTPGEDPEAKRESLKVTHTKPARFRFKNLIIGGLGGAVFGGGIAVLFLSKNDKDGSLDMEKAKVMGPIGAGAGALIGGLLGFFLGATTPTGPLPPEMQTRLDPQLFDGVHVAYSVQF